MKAEKIIDCDVCTQRFLVGETVCKHIKRKALKDKLDKNWDESRAKMEKRRMANKLDCKQRQARYKKKYGTFVKTSLNKLSGRLDNTDP